MKTKIYNASVVVDGGVIEGGTVVFENGVITYVGTELPETYESFDA